MAAVCHSTSGSCSRSQATFGPIDCWVIADPVRRSTSAPASARRSAATSAAALASFCCIDGRNGRPASSRQMSAGTMPATPMPRRSPSAAPAAVSTAGISSHALRHHVAGSSSAQPA